MTVASQTAHLPRVFAPPAANRRERRKADIRDRLFRAALELFATRGFASTTVEDITRAADVAKGTFFNYFPTKEHLLTEFSELRLDIVRDLLVGARSRLLHRLLVAASGCGKHHPREQNRGRAGGQMSRFAVIDG